MYWNTQLHLNTFKSLSEPLSFNLSHSPSLIFYSLARSGRSAVPSTTLFLVSSSLFLLRSETGFSWTGQRSSSHWSRCCRFSFSARYNIDRNPYRNGHHEAGRKAKRRKRIRCEWIVYDVHTLWHFQGQFILVEIKRSTWMFRLQRHRMRMSTAERLLELPFEHRERVRRNDRRLRSRRMPRFKDQRS